MLLPAPGLPGHSIRLGESQRLGENCVAISVSFQLRQAGANRSSVNILIYHNGLKLDGFPSKATRVAPYGFPFKTPICAKPSCGVKILLALVMYCFDCLLMDPRRGGRAPLRGFKPIGSRNVPLAFLGWAPQNGARVFSFWLP